MEPLPDAFYLPYHFGCQCTVGFNTEHISAWVLSSGTVPLCSVTQKSKQSSEVLP